MKKQTNRKHKEVKKNEKKSLSKDFFAHCDLQEHRESIRLMPLQWRACVAGSELPPLHAGVPRPCAQPDAHSSRPT